MGNAVITTHAVFFKYLGFSVEVATVFRSDGNKTASDKTTVESSLLNNAVNLSFTSETFQRNGKKIHDCCQNNMQFFFPVLEARRTEPVLPKINLADKQVYCDTKDC